MQFTKKYKIALASSAVVLLLILLVGFIALLAAYTNKSTLTSTAYNKFNSCEQLTDYLNNAQPTYYPYALESKTEGSSGGPSTIAKDSTYSTTNTQVAGIDELDTIKTNGKHIFKSTANKVTILDLDLKEVSTVESTSTIRGLYLQNDKLVVVGDGFSFNNSFTQLEVYNIANITKPVKTGTVATDGNYFTSRLSKDGLILVTNYSPNNVVELDEAGISESLPQIKIDQQAVANPIDCEDVAYVGNPVTNFSVITKIDLSDLNNYSMQAVVANFDYVYLNNSAILLTQAEYELVDDSSEQDIARCAFGSCPEVRPPFPSLTSTGKTNIIKLVQNKQQLDFAGAVNVNGRILDQFAIDVNQDFIRVATTGIGDMNRLESESSNVFVIDANLNIVGSVTGIAAGEQIYSARFTPNTLYLVTYRQVDPFYIVDLTSPTSPKLLGELKVPGYSEYLHPVNETQVLGTGIKDTNVQVSLFNVKDLTNPSLLDSFEIDLGSYTTSAGNFDHTQLTFYPEKELVALPISSYYPEYSSTINLVSYTNNSLSNLGTLDACSSQEEDFYYYTSDLRTVFVNNNVYAVCNNQITKFDLTTLSAVNKFAL